MLRKPCRAQPTMPSPGVQVGCSLLFCNLTCLSACSSLFCHLCHVCPAVLHAALRIPARRNLQYPRQACSNAAPLSSAICNRHLPSCGSPGVSFVPHLSCCTTCSTLCSILSCVTCHVMQQLAAKQLNICSSYNHLQAHDAPDCCHVLVQELGLVLCSGGRLSSKPVAKWLVIDVREFMSSLPSVLHQQGLQIVPVTLEVPTFCATTFVASKLQNRF